MFQNKDCCYTVYRNLIKEIKRSGKYQDFKDVCEKHPNEYLVLRHDIEFSIKRAFALSRVEYEEGIESSYLVQITNHAYNPFSDVCVKMLNEMSQMGHHIGLHYHMGLKTDTEAIKKEIAMQAEVLEKMTGIVIDRFSFHRPPSNVLNREISVKGLINMYGREFFVYTDQIDENIEVKYIADSNHQWKYGYPDTKTFNKYQKIQLLVHPLSWSEQGADHVRNFQMLTQEKHDDFVATVEAEWKIFDELRGRL